MWWLFSPGCDCHSTDFNVQVIQGNLPRKYLRQIFEKWVYCISGCFVFHLPLLTNKNSFSYWNIMLSQKSLRSWEMQKPQILWQTENRAYHKIHSTFQIITLCELLAGRVRWFQRNELSLAQQFPQHLLSTVKVCKKKKKCWCMKNNGGMLEVAESAWVVKLSVCVWTVYHICCPNSAHQEKSLSSHK